MPTQPYLNAKGERVPGVTTVIGANLGWNKDALKLWANREGLAGREMRRDWGGSTMERAANIGTAAHGMIEAHVLGLDVEAGAAALLAKLCPEDQTKARRGFQNFLRWYSTSQLRVTRTEFPFVDEEYQFGGCPDALIEQPSMTEGEPVEETIGDWKSSKGTYADHFIQVAAYVVGAERFLTKERGHPVRLAGAHVIRVGKDTGVFSHKYWSRDDLELGWSAFTRLRGLHLLRWKIEAFVK